MKRGGAGSRQPGGGRQIAGPRGHDRGAAFAQRPKHRFSNRPKRGWKDEKRRPSLAGKSADAPAPKPAEPTQLPATGVQNVTVTPDEVGMRVDRFLEARFPGLAFSHIQRVIRKGELRVNGRRVAPKDRLKAGQAVRIPPLRLEPPKPREEEGDAKTRALLRSITLYEDADVLVLNKPMGLAVQGGSGTVRHVDGMLEVLRDAKGQRPRLVHRLDKDTAGCLLVAKTRFAASALAKNFRSREARKIYWALVAGVPKPRQGRVSTFLAKEELESDSRMHRRAASPRRHGRRDRTAAAAHGAIVEPARLRRRALRPDRGRAGGVAVRLSNQLMIRVPGAAQHESGAPRPGNASISASSR